MAEFIIESPTSHATLGIRFGGDYSELCIGDRPLALTWSISDGSIMDHLIRCDHPDGVAHLKIFRDSLFEGAQKTLPSLNLLVPSSLPEFIGRL